MTKKTRAIVAAATMAVCLLALLFIFFAVGGAHYGCVDDGCRICCMLDAFGGMLDELLAQAFGLCVAVLAGAFIHGAHPRRSAERQINPVLLRVRLLN